MGMVLHMAEVFCSHVLCFYVFIIFLFARCVVLHELTLQLHGHLISAVPAVRSLASPYRLLHLGRSVGRSEGRSPGIGKEQRLPPYGTLVPCRSLPAGREISLSYCWGGVHPVIFCAKRGEIFYPHFVLLCCV